MSTPVIESPVVSTPNVKAPKLLVLAAALFSTIAWASFLGWSIGRIIGVW